MMSNNSFAALVQKATPVPREALELALEAVALDDVALWNQWRWIPTGVFSHESRVCKGCVLPKGSWTCGFGPCGGQNRGGKVCFTCFQPRNDDVEMAYCCRGRCCKEQGRSLQFGTVHDLLNHLVSHEGFDMVECQHCADTIWVSRLKDHIAEDHPPTARSAKAGAKVAVAKKAARKPGVDRNPQPKAVPAAPKSYEELFPAL